MTTFLAMRRAGCGLLQAFCWCAVLGAGGPAAGAASQAGANDSRLRVLSPTDGSFVSGAVSLRAEVEPADAVTSVVFFVDGRQLCTVVMPPFECAWDAGSAIIEHQIRVVANLVGGGRIVRPVRTKGVAYTEKVEVDVVQVTATVVDGRGRYIKGLPQSAFHVSEDDRPQTISHFAAEDVPLELIVAVDISGSMGPSMAKMKKAVKEFLAAVPARNQVTLLGFNDTVIPLTRGSKSPEDRLKAVDRLASWGGTALYDAILSAVDTLGRQVGRKAVVIFSDGEDEGSHVALADVEQRLEASDVTLYMIGQGRGLTLDALKKVMERLSRPTGGRALFTDSIDELHDAFNDLLDELSHQYLLGYPPTNDVRDNTIRRIKVTLDGPYQIRARQSYRAAPTR
ncbi:MAG: VWA domain-containing protein [Acidobacteriota bacterium]